MKNPIKTSIVAITILRTNPGIGMCAHLELHVLEIIYYYVLEVLAIKVKVMNE